MSKTVESEILLVGLTGTGKTNFLVGLDVILDNQTDPDGLVHSEHGSDRAYLEPLRGQWLRGEHLKHTSRQIPPPPHQLMLAHPASGTQAAFHIPDLAGETFDSHFSTRAIPLEFGNRIQNAVGLILFLHCEHAAEHELIEHPHFIDPEPEVESEPVGIAATPEAEWLIEQASKQVKIVDLLQFFDELRKSPIRIAVAISAWERVENAVVGIVPGNPDCFLKKQWPLLSQYLESNRSNLPFRTFGVSARGGGMSPGEIERLIKLVDPSERVIVVDGNHRSNDLTRPVRWLLGLFDT